MLADELMTRIGRLAFDIEEGRRCAEPTDVIRQMLDDLTRAVRLAPGDDRRQALMAEVERRLNALD